MTFKLVSGHGLFSSHIDTFFQCFYNKFIVGSINRSNHQQIDGFFFQHLVERGVGIAFGSNVLMGVF